MITHIMAGRSLLPTPARPRLPGHTFPGIPVDTISVQTLRPRLRLTLTDYPCATQGMILQETLLPANQINPVGGSQKLLAGEKEEPRNIPKAGDTGILLHPLSTPEDRLDQPVEI